MIDAREEVLSSAPTQHRRRAAASASVTPARGSKASALPIGKPARIERIFSDAKVKPFDQI
jgi:hypothetical protein